MKSATDVAATLGNMKGALMKIGQLASFIDPGVPDAFREALAELQANAPPMSAELAAGVVESELGAPPQELFAVFDDTPVASASIGQVHRAITKDGRAVAVKVQYPGVDDAIAADLANTDLAALVAPFMFKGLDAKAVADELRARLTEELDYELEARRQQRFADWYAGHPTIRVPRVIEELSTRRVLTSELAEGARFGEVERWSERERNLAAETIYRFVFGSIYRMRAFNGDPHPGNYLFQPGGVVTFLDFGLVKEFDALHVAQMVEMIDAAVLRRRPGSIREVCERLGFVALGAPVLDEAMEDFMAVFFEMVSRDEATAITPKWAAEVARRLLVGRASHGEVVKWANMPPQFVVLQRINLGVLALLGQLRATANWRAISEEIWPGVGGRPSTPMGEAEARWLSERHPELRDSLQEVLDVVEARRAGTVSS
jgi:predicted unusual protein kinase regulating ubiquinone biosynthesis (AarF/ABC1/UbiB family)